MATAQRFDWDAEPDPPAPAMPFHGKTAAARHSSWTGARAAVKVWTAKRSAYLQILNVGGALTDQEAAAILRWPLSSVNSTRNGIEAQAIKAGQPSPFESCGHEFKHWDDGRVTSRTRWGLVNRSNVKEVMSVGDTKDSDGPEQPATGDPAGDAPATDTGAAAGDGDGKPEGDEAGEAKK